MGINIVAISGNLTYDPELRVTQSGTQVLNFGIAVNESHKDANGEWQEYANFISCVIFGKRAESLSKFLAKGMKVTVSGKLHQSRWEKDGEKRQKIEIIASDVDLPPRPKDRAQAGYKASAPAPSTPPPGDVYDADIPF